MSEAAERLVAAVKDYLDGGGNPTRMRLFLRNWGYLGSHLTPSGTPGDPPIVAEPPDPAVAAALEAVKAAFYADDTRIVDEVLTGLRPLFGGAVKEPARGWVAA